jgi:signal peptidase
VSRLSFLWGRRARRWAFRAVFAASMALALLAYGIPLWYHTHGQRILVVTSGSMAPTFNTGDAVVITKISPSELRPGQVVTFWPMGHQGNLTTHRIINLLERPDYIYGTTTPIEGPNGEAQVSQYIQTQGDANGDPDYNLTPVANVRGAVTEVKKGWGYPLGYAHSPLGRFLIFAPPLALLLGAELMSWRRRPKPSPTTTSTKTRENRDAVATPA